MDDRKIEELVAMIDQFMSGGGGHMDIRKEEDGNLRTDKTKAKTITVTPTLECTPGRNMACTVPTLFEGLDEDNTES